MSGLQLSSTEAFVLAQIDGTATLDNVADATGVPVERVISIAFRLEELGAIERAQTNGGGRASAAGLATGRYVDVAPKTPPKSAPVGPAPAAARAEPTDEARLLQIPRRTVADIHAIAMKLETGDAFLLSNVDGASSVQELADILGGDPGRVMQRVEALARAGALELDAPSARASVRRNRAMPRASEPPARPPRRSSKHDLGGRPGAPGRPSASALSSPRAKPGRASQAKIRAARAASPPPATPAPAARPSRAPPRPESNDTSRRPSRVNQVALTRHPVLDEAEAPPVSAPRSAPPRDDQACDLDPQTRAKLDAATAMPPGRTHYAVLGVAAGATTKEISRAYFGLAATLHPDRYFGKRLGPYKKKLEEAFRTASDAYEVLRSTTRRAEYDVYLGLTRKSVEMEAALAPLVPVPPVSTKEVAAPVVPPRAALPPPPPAAPAPPSPIPVKGATPAPPAPPAPVIRDRTQKDSPVVPASVGASSLKMGIAPPARMPSMPAGPKISVALRPEDIPPVSVPAPRLSQAPGGSEVARSSPSIAPRASARSLVAAAKSVSFLDEAQQALARGDAPAAANLYRLALEYADDPSSRAYAQAGLNDARAIVADTYLKTARYEEKEARWSDAVVSYEKALDRRPGDPAICERLANALRQEGQDLLRAARLAELAVSRAPRNVTYCRTLGMIYADAGLREKAIEQFEKAAEIEPADEVTNRALAVLRKQKR